MKINYNNFAVTFLVISAVACFQPLVALTFIINPKSDIVGEVQYVVIKKGDSLYSIARAHDLGTLEIQEANPKVNPNKLKPGTKLLIPTEFILPPGERSGVVINLAEMRVYYFTPDGQTVTTHPLGIGRQGWHTPIGETTIARKREYPTWTPPDSIRAEAEERGVDLPDVIPAGPHNPLGDYALNLGWNGYAMHGTNAPTSVGSRSSHGCMRMYAEDIDNLFHVVEVGTKVRVIYEPYKLGVKDGQLFLEAHDLFPDNYYQTNNIDKFDLLKDVVNEVNYPKRSKINWNEAQQLINETYGYPVNITGAQSNQSI